MTTNDTLKDFGALEAAINLKVSHIDVLARHLYQDLIESDLDGDQSDFASLLVDQVRDLKPLIQQAVKGLKR